MSLKDLVKRLGNQDGREECRQVRQRDEYAVDDIGTEMEGHARMRVGRPTMSYLSFYINQLLTGIMIITCADSISYPQPSHLTPFPHHRA